MDWREKCFDVHSEGLLKIRKGESLPFILRVFNSNGMAIPKDLVLPEGPDSHMRVLLKTVTVSMLAETHVGAALIQSDARSVDGDKFAKYFGIAEAVKNSVEEYLKEYTRIVHEKFHDKITDLPQEVWCDALMTCIKGPEVMPVSFLTNYRKNSKQEIEFEPTKEKSGFKLSILPDWWKSTIN